MTFYKLTDQKMQTREGYQWEMGVWHEATGDISKGLCSDAWLHCCDSPLLAILHNPICGNIPNPRLFEVEVDGESKDDRGIKCGHRRMKIVREIPIPEISTVQLVAYGILCVKAAFCFEKWNIWADKWLSNEDRTPAAAYAAANAAHAGGGIVGEISANIATNAAYAAYDVAYIASVVAADASIGSAYDAVHIVNNVAYVVGDVTDVIANVARIKTITLNLVQIAEQAMRVK